MMNNLKINHHFKNIDWDRAIVHLSVILFGLFAWTGVHAINMEMPIFVSMKGWNLPANITMAVQIASFGPLIYGFLQLCKCELNESWLILCLMCSNILAIGMLVVHINTTTLLIAGFFSGLVSSFSSVLFMPYLRDFDHVFIVSYYIGEGVSSIAGITVAIIQGMGNPMKCNNTIVGNTTEFASLESKLRFSERYFFLYVTVLLVLSLLSFLFLRYSPFIQNKRDSRHSIFVTQKIQLIGYQNNSELPASVSNHCVNDTRSIGHTSSKEENKVANDTIATANELSARKRIYLYALIGIYCFFSMGFLPSIQTYASLPYGEFAYELGVICVSCVFFFAYLMMIWIKVSDIRIISCLSLICLTAGCYIISLALLSPTPPLQKSTVGISLLVLSWCVLMGLASYLRLTILSLLKRASSSTAVLHIGAIIQAGSSFGTLIATLLINFTNLFKSGDSSAHHCA